MPKATAQVKWMGDALSDFPGIFLDDMPKATAQVKWMGGALSDFPGFEVKTMYTDDSGEFKVARLYYWGQLIYGYQA